MQVSVVALHILYNTACDASSEQDQQLDMLCHWDKSRHAHVQLEAPDISLLPPVLQQQWDKARNAHMGHMVVLPKSTLEVWWTCDLCPDGHLHSWLAPISERAKGRGCPQCSGSKVCQHNCLATKAPLIAAQWDHEDNDGTPSSILAQSRHAVGLHCNVCSHKWSTTPHSRVSDLGADCLQCSARGKMKAKHPTFAECQHHLLAEWDHQRNAAQGNFPSNTSLQSHKHILWLCPQCPAGQQHSWSARPYHRTSARESQCPFCARRCACDCNSLQALYPEIAAEWDHAKNSGQPSDYPAGSYHLAWWFHPKRLSWQQTIRIRTQNVQQRIARHKCVQ